MNLKRLPALALTAVIALGTFSPVQAAEKNAWAKAYLKVLEDLEYKDKYTSYDLIYVDNDNVPELVAGQDGYWINLYTFYKGKAVPVLKQAAYGYEYIKKKNVIHRSVPDYDYNGAVYDVYYGKISKGKLTDRNKKDLTVRYFVDKNKNGRFEAEEYTSNPSYYYGKQKVSKKNFDKHTVKGSLKQIKGKVSYDNIVKKLKKKAAAKDTISASLVKQWKGTYKCGDKVIKITKVTNKGISGTRKQMYANAEGGYYTKSFSISFSNSKKTAAKEEYYEGSGQYGMYDEYKLGKGKITLVHPKGRVADEVYTKK